MHAVLTAVLAAIASLIGGASDPHEATVQPAPALIVLGGTEVQHDQLDKALSQFEAANLSLPPITVEFAPEGDLTLCQGNAGLYTQGSTETPNHVAICHRSPIFLLHELGHAYVHLNLDDAERSTFLQHLGLTEWNDASAKWSARGGERAANTIAYTLTLTEPTQIDNIAVLVCDYETLTGSSHVNVANADCADIA